MSSMNELIQEDRGILTPISHSEPRHLGTNFHVKKEALKANIENVISMSLEAKSEMGKNAREWYLSNKNQFAKTIIEILKTKL